MLFIAISLFLVMALGVNGERPILTECKDMTTGETAPYDECSPPGDGPPPPPNGEGEKKKGPPPGGPQNGARGFHRRLANHAHVSMYVILALNAAVMEGLVAQVSSALMRNGKWGILMSVAMMTTGMN